MKIFLVYLILINAAGFLIMLADKHRAVKNKRRIPEKTLFLIALIGGSLGSNLGMRAARHKTRHLSFTLGMPLILCLQILLGIVLYHI